MCVSACLCPCAYARVCVSACLPVRVCVCVCMSRDAGEHELSESARGCSGGRRGRVRMQKGRVHMQRGVCPPPQAEGGVSPPQTGV
jgi:hypothetical protein